VNPDVFIRSGNSYRSRVLSRFCVGYVMRNLDFFVDIFLSFLLKLKFPVLCFVDHVLSFCLFSVDHLSFFNLRILITPLVSSNSSYKSYGKWWTRKGGRDGGYDKRSIYLVMWHRYAIMVKQEFNVFTRNSWLRNVFVTSNSLSRITVLTVILTQLTLISLFVNS
jgi:hypothetical protein